MLVLSRKEGESIILNLPNCESISITLSKYVGLQTKVSINAPKNVKVLRKELTEREFSTISHNKVIE